jgi:hypothetical protein
MASVSTTEEEGRTGGLSVDFVAAMRSSLGNSSQKRFSLTKLNADQRKERKIDMKYTKPEVVDLGNAAETIAGCGSKPSCQSDHPNGLSTGAAYEADE